VRAQADQHGDLRLDRAEFGIALEHVVRLLVLVAGLGVLQPAIKAGQCLEDGLGPLDDPDRLAAPFQDQPLAFLQGADVGGHRGTGQLGPRTGIPRFDERYSCETYANCSDHRGGRCQEPATPGIDWIVYPIVGHPALRLLIR
jgi:hypothetical protein